MRSALLLLFITSSFAVSAQHEKDAIQYFGRIKNSREFTQLVYRSLPDSSDWYGIFTDSAAKRIIQHYSQPHWAYYNLPDSTSKEYKNPTRIFEEAHIGERYTVERVMKEPRVYNQVAMYWWTVDNTFRSKERELYYIVHSDTLKYINFSFYWTYVNDKWVYIGEFYEALY